MVAEMFASDLEAGHRLWGLTKHLMALGVPTPRGLQRWPQPTVRGILSNPVYTGEVDVGRLRSRPARMRHSARRPMGDAGHGYVRTPPAAWTLVAQIPAIVSQEPCELVQAQLAPNQRFAVRHNTAHDALLRALISGGQWRLAWMARTLPAGYAYDTCRGKLPPSHSCRETKGPTRFIPAKQLDALVWRDLCAVVTQPAVLTQALQRAQGGQWLPQERQARRDQRRTGRVPLVQQLDRLTEAYLAHVIPLAAYQRRRHDLAQRMPALASQAQRLEASADRHAELATFITSIEDFCQRVPQG
jgi:site-specific DNA recombinase